MTHFHLHIRCQALCLQKHAVLTKMPLPGVQ